MFKRKVISRNTHYSATTNDASISHYKFLICHYILDTKRQKQNFHSTLNVINDTMALRETQLSYLDMEIKNNKGFSKFSFTPPSRQRWQRSTTYGMAMGDISTDYFIG